MISARTTIEANDVQQKFGEIASGLVVEAARKQTRPVIYGLDDGPKIVSQKP